MVNISRGDMVYILFPNQEGSGFSEKLSIVLTNENSLVSLVPCTRSTNQEFRYTKTILVEAQSAWGQQMGLKADSIIILDRLTSFPLIAVQRKKNGSTVPEDLLNLIEFELESP